MAGTLILGAELQIDKLFATPLATLRLPAAEALNGQLKPLILARRDLDHGVQHSNQGGWQSAADFLDWAGESGQRLYQFAERLATELTAVHHPQRGLLEPVFPWRCNCWANVNEAGQSNALHGHPGAFWSAVYWVDAGDEPGQNSAGELEFLDPRGLMPSVYNPELRMRIEGCLSAGYATAIQPVSGTLVMFPSWLLHGVKAFRGSRPRLSVAFNFGL